MLALIFFLDGKLAFGARLGGAYYVDDAEIACVVDVGRPVEFGTSLVDIRFDGQEDILATVTAKTVPIPIGRTGFGLAIAEAIVYDPLNQTGSGLIVNVPLTFEFNKDFRLNLNFGAQYCSGGDPPRIVRHCRRGRLLDFVPHWSVISEVFALMGPGQTNPRFQSGLRYSPTKDIDFDVIYGRNLLGEWAN